MTACGEIQILVGVRFQKADRGVGKIRCRPLASTEWTSDPLQTVVPTSRSQLSKGGQRCPPFSFGCGVDLQPDLKPYGRGCGSTAGSPILGQAALRWRPAGASSNLRGKWRLCPQQQTVVTTNERFLPLGVSAILLFHRRVLA